MSTFTEMVGKNISWNGLTINLLNFNSKKNTVMVEIDFDKNWKLTSETKANSWVFRTTRENTTFFIEIEKEIEQGRYRRIEKQDEDKIISVYDIGDELMMRVNSKTGEQAWKCELACFYLEDMNKYFVGDEKGKKEEPTDKVIKKIIQNINHTTK